MASEDTEANLACCLYREATVTNSGDFFRNASNRVAFVSKPLETDC